MEFLSLSCPRASEFVLRKKKIGDREVYCRRGNAEVISQFFGTLISSVQVEQVKLHILEMRPQDEMIFEEHLKRNCNYKVKSIVFNQSIDPQLVIKLSLQCLNLEYLLVRGYNQKYPSDKTDYLIKVPTHNCDYSPWEIIESQVPLMCEPFEWAHGERERILRKVIPERIFNDKFIVNSEFFFNEPMCDIEKKFPVRPHRNCRFLTINGSKRGVYYEMTYCTSRSENNSFKLALTKPIHAIYNSRDEKEKLRTRFLMLKSEEEWDVDPNQKSIMDMPVELVKKILENATFKDKFALGSTCSRLRSFLESRRYSFSKVVLGGNFVRADIDGEHISINTEEESHAFGKMVLKIGNIKNLEIHMSERQFKRLLEETQHYEPFEIEHIKYFTFVKDLIVVMKIFLTEKCLGSLKSIELGCAGRETIIYETQLFRTLADIESVGIRSTYYKASCKMLDTFVEKWTRGESKVGSTLKIVHSYDSLKRDQVRNKYKNRKISEQRHDICTSICIRTNNPEKHILIQYSYTQMFAEIVSSDRDITNYIIEGIEDPEDSEDELDEDDLWAEYEEEMLQALL